MGSANPLALAARIVLPSWKKLVLDPPKDPSELRKLAVYCAARSNDLALDGPEYDGASRRFGMLADYFSELAREDS